MRISDDRYRRDLRRYQLARRLFAHGARRATIMRWTGLSRHSVETMMHEYALIEHRRPRGPVPENLRVFTRSLVHEVECAAMAYMVFQLDIIPRVKAGARRRDGIDLTLGEQLVTAYDLYRALVPVSPYRVEHMALLTQALATPGSLALEVCEKCEGLIVIPQGGTPSKHCGFCRSQSNGYARLFMPQLDDQEPTVSADPQASSDSQRSNP